MHRIGVQEDEMNYSFDLALLLLFHPIGQTLPNEIIEELFEKVINEKNLST